MKSRQGARWLPVMILGVMLTRPVAAQETGSMIDSVRDAVDRSVELADVGQLAGAVALAERAVAMRPADKLIRHYYGYALYRLAALTLGRDGSEKARPWVDKASGVIEALAADSTGPALGETYAMLSAVYGLRIATSKIQMVAGIRFGSKSTEWMDRAVTVAPSNPRVWMLRGVGALNTPSAFGGGLDKAAGYLQKAVELFAQDSPGPGLPAWGRAETHGWLGQVYARQHRIDEARTEYQAALVIEPRNAWVRTLLLPSLDKSR